MPTTQTVDEYEAQLQANEQEAKRKRVQAAELEWLKVCEEGRGLLAAGVGWGGVG